MDVDTASPAMRPRDQRESWLRSWGFRLGILLYGGLLVLLNCSDRRGHLDLTRLLLSREQKQALQAAQELARERASERDRVLHDPMRPGRAAAQRMRPPYTTNPGGTAIECAGVPSVLGLWPNEPVDYIALRSLVFGHGTGSRASTVPKWPPGGADLHWTETAFHTDMERGVACASASSPACLETVRHHPKEHIGTDCPDDCTEISIVTTRGDLVERWATTEELERLLAPIDSLDEAAMLAIGHGYELHCDHDEQMRMLPDGYEFEAYAPYLDVIYEGPQRASLIHVSRSGQFTQMRLR